MAWTGVDEIPVYTANQFIAQLQGIGTPTPEQIILVGGHVSPPIFLGADAEAQAHEFAQSGKKVPIKPIFRVSLTRTRAAELVNLLSTMISQFDQQQQEEGGEDEPSSA